MRIQNYIIVLLILTSKITLSQTNSFVLPDLTKKLFQKQEIVFSFNSPSRLIQTDYSFSNTLKQEVRPVFCKMEDNLHKRFNVWITLRAGSDADYRKLISSPK